MQDVTRNSYSLYKRNSGLRTIWYVRFWDDELQSYSAGRSTGQTAKAVAHRIAQKWLSEGVPAVQTNDYKAMKKRIISTMTRYLELTRAISKDRVVEEKELIKMFYTQVTKETLGSDERFVEYLYRFWDWEGEHVQKLRELKKPIGLRYVNDCRSRIKKHIEPYFKDMLLTDVTIEALEKFMMSFTLRDEKFENGYSRRTVNMIMKVIIIALKDALRLKKLLHDPVGGLELFADDTRERGILNPKELQKVFTFPWKDERSKTASILAAVSGMRVSEIIALRMSDLDIEHNIISVHKSYSTVEKTSKTTKSGKARYVYTDPAIIQMLVSLHDKNPFKGPFIFYSTSATKPMRVETIERSLKAVLEDVIGKEDREERNITFHCFRHFYNSTIRGSVPDETLRLQMGHLSKKMTDVYDHITDERGEKLRKATQEMILPFISFDESTVKSVI
jgi:integrase